MYKNLSIATNVIENIETSVDETIIPAHENRE